MKNEANNVALVDVFARNAKKIKLKGDRVETHTVLLLKMPRDTEGKHAVFVVDPSNFTFSSHFQEMI